MPSSVGCFLLCAVFVLSATAAQRYLHSNTAAGVLVGLGVGFLAFGIAALLEEWGPRK